MTTGVKIKVVLVLAILGAMAWGAKHPDATWRAYRGVIDPFAKGLSDAFLKSTSDAVPPVNH